MLYLTKHINKIILVVLAFSLIANGMSLYMGNSKKISENNVSQEVMGSSELNKAVQTNSEYKGIGDKIVIFHAYGDMSRDALSFVSTITYSVDKKDFHDIDNQILMREMTGKFLYSNGISDDFSHLPIIFIKDKAYSGFDTNIKESLSREIYG